DMGDVEAGLAYQRRGLAIAEKGLGPAHPHVARLLKNLGSTYAELGDLRSASDYLRRALAIEEKALGAEHPEVAATLLRLAALIYHQKKRENFETAVGYLTRALSINEKVSGPDSLAAAEVLVELALLESERKQPNGLAHLQRALKIEEKLTPARNPMA